jgi:hypothetical protein
MPVRRSAQERTEAVRLQASGYSVPDIASKAGRSRGSNASAILSVVRGRISFSELMFRPLNWRF